MATVRGKTRFAQPLANQDHLSKSHLADANWPTRVTWGAIRGLNGCPSLGRPTLVLANSFETSVGLSHSVQIVASTSYASLIIEGKLPPK